MKINREQLVDLLAQKTGLERERIEGQLSQLVSHIKNAAEEGKSYQIERFGTFHMEGDELHFDPAPELKTEVNNKYAGLDPIELIGAYEESDPADTPEEEDDIWGYDEVEDDESEMSEAVPEPKQEIGEDPEPELSDDDPFDLEEDSEVPDDEDSDPDPDPEPESELESELVAEESEKGSESPSSPNGFTPGRPKKKPNASVSNSILITAAAMVIIVIVSSWFLFDEIGGREQATPTGSAMNEPREAEPEPDLGGQEEPQQVEVPTDPAPDSEEPEPENGVAEDSPGEQYGLTGSVNPEANDGYTIILFSLKDRDNAESMQASLNERGYRTIMRSATVSGVRYWRIGIGQFPSIGVATEAANGLPEPYNDDFFITRIK